MERKVIQVEERPPLLLNIPLSIPVSYTHLTLPTIA